MFLAEGATDTVRGASVFVRTCAMLSAFVEAFPPRWRDLPKDEELRVLLHGVPSQRR